MDMRWLLVVAPLFVFGCFTVGDDGGSDGGGDDAPRGCTSNDDCRSGRLCIDRDGNLDDICDEGETCVCTTVTSGTGGSSGSSTGGSSTGGSSEGGSTTGGTATGGSSEGGSSEGGSATGGSTTGGNTTGGSSTGGSSGGVCGPYCDRLVGAMCATVTETSCLASCNGISADCPTELEALSACVANPANSVMCVSGQVTVQGCDAPLEAADRCLVCVPETADTGCDTCTKTTCCDTLGDYNVAPDGAAFFTCASPCTTEACFDACVAMYPIAGNALVALAECQDGSCAEPCICEAAPDDTVCNACNKTSCCSSYVDYLQSTNFAEFDACALPCTTNACIDACTSQYPRAGAAYAVWSYCLYASCYDACSM